ncbi:snurportin-1 [Entomortierella parvispora]|uniref:Snurportin-1 n=1 Tax=Entomortierella parvispora TaxID=205924 RepID=A0A9P3HGU9_9FUNG|nr:snurportin-1 [Entomortierella parvispora]
MPDHSRDPNGSAHRDENSASNTTSTSNGGKSKADAGAGSALSSDPLVSPGTMQAPPSATTDPTSTSSTAAFAFTSSAIGSSMSLVSVSHATVDALGNWLESASVQSIPAAQEQRRKDSYKSGSLIAKTLKQSQEERRKQALAEQAKKRYQFTNHARKLALFASGQDAEASSGSEGDEDDDADDDDDNSNGKLPGAAKSQSEGVLGLKGSVTDQVIVTKPHKRRLSSDSEPEVVEGSRKDRVGDALSPKKPRLQKTTPKAVRRKKDRNPFRDQLMIPEPMTEIPADLDTSYYIVPLPIGHRCFVISADGKTTARLPSGQLLVGAFESCLPAGSNTYRGNRRTDYCILDCVYSSATRTFWTIDIMCWRGHPVYDCETEFRFWWLRGKLAEIESLQGKWIASQTKEWDQEVAKKRQKRARQAKRRQEKAAAAATLAASSRTNPTIMEDHESAILAANDQEGDDGDDEAVVEGMSMDEDKAGLHQQPKKFWPVVFTPLPYFNASTDLVRLLAESMHSTPASTSPVLSMTANTDSQTSGIGTSSDGNQRRSSTGMTVLGTMGLSGEIATAASLFPAHDNAQKSRQVTTLIYEKAAGLVFFNKKTMYVLGTTPLCGWVAMNQVGEVFFDDEGGIGPAPGTSAVEGREVEMEDALEKIRLQ